MRRFVRDVSHGTWMSLDVSPDGRRLVMDILGDLNQKEGTTIVMVTHDPRMADKTHRVVRLFDGRQVQ